VELWEFKQWWKEIIYHWICQSFETKWLVIIMLNLNQNYQTVLFLCYGPEFAVTPPLILVVYQ
jgi:hypothetical protein